MRSGFGTTLKEIFHSARELQPHERSGFLDETCGANAQLRREIEALLASYEQADGFIADPPAHLAAELLADRNISSAVGRTIGHYQLLERIGAGGMGEVYLAEDLWSGRKAALKLLAARFAGDKDRYDRFQREARAVVALNHPNILTVYETGQEDSTYYIVSELIEGETLRERLKRGPTSIHNAVELGIQAASALGAAHKAGIMHRDIKPDNIMPLRRSHAATASGTVGGMAKYDATYYCKP